jgi:hypothetical protein
MICPAGLAINVVAAAVAGGRGGPLTTCVSAAGDGGSYNDNLNSIKR